MRGRRTSRLITLDAKTQATLEAWVTRRRALPVAIVKRAQLILLCHAGLSITASGAQVGMSRRHCYKWLERFRQYGVEGLSDWRSGHPTPRVSKDA